MKNSAEFTKIIMKHNSAFERRLKMEGILKAIVQNPLVRKGAQKVLGTIIVSMTVVGLGTVVQLAGDGIMDAIKKASKETS
jgi:hypothetical protein